MANAEGKPHVYGPWNIDISGALHLEANNNVFFQNTDPSSDMIWNIIPEIRFEYEQFQNVLFEAELKLDSSLHSKYGEADMTETFLHVAYRPAQHVRYGGYFLFSDDYERYRTYAPFNGLLTGGINTVRIGGGYGGKHLDASATASFTRGIFSPSEFSVLNYSRSSYECNITYLHNSLYWISGIEFGRLNYSSSMFNDGSFWDIKGGVGKDFSPKTNLEFIMKYVNQNHTGSSGDDFKGLLFSLNAKRISYSGKSSLRVVLEKEILPSTVVGSDFAKKMSIGLISNSKFNSIFSAAFKVSMEFYSVGSRDDTGINLSFNGDYKYNKLLNVEFGLETTSLTSSIEEFEFRQFRMFFGISAVY